MSGRVGGITRETMQKNAGPAPSGRGTDRDRPRHEPKRPKTASASAVLSDCPALGFDSNQLAEVSLDEAFLATACFKISSNSLLKSEAPLALKEGMKTIVSGRLSSP
jgi:hypothetical protein